MLRMIRKRVSGEKGFTLVELLVVVIIIAILSAIAIPTYLGQRQKAQDTASKSLVRIAMTAVEAAYTDAQTFNGINATALSGIEPSVQWVAGAAADVTTAALIGADTGSRQVKFSFPDDQSYSLATYSAAKHTYGVTANKKTGATSYYKNAAVGTW